MLSAVVGVQVYCCLAVMALAERGYFALGGEVLAAFVAGGAAYLAFSLAFRDGVEGRRKDR